MFSVVARPADGQREEAMKIVRHDAPNCSETSIAVLDTVAK